MVDDELPPNEDAAPDIPPGPRRSTYTPPPGGIRYDDVAVEAGADAGVETARGAIAGDEAADDDALAGAIAQEFQRWAPPSAPTPPAPAPAQTAPAPAQTAPPSLPAGVPAPPRRRSLSDAELVAAADPARADSDSAALLDLVEQQLALRQAEAAELAQWEAAVRATAPDRADALLAPVREQFRDVLPRGAATAPPSPPTEVPSMAERLASAPPPERLPEPPPATGDASAPSIDLALADAPPPWGQVPSAAVPPPSIATPTSPASGASPGSPASPQSPESPASVGSPPEPPPLVEPARVGHETIDPAPVAPGALGVVSASPTPAPESGLGLFDSLLREPDPTPPDADDDGAVSPSEPIESPVAVATASQESDGAAPQAPASRLPAVEVIALEPTPAEYRAGRSLRLFWFWFAVNASVVSLALGAVILGLGVSLRQAVLAALIGVALSFLPLGLGTLSGKWSGQPTMVVSRATFGTLGNAIPAVVALLTRLAWAAALLWMLAAGTTEILIGAGLVPDSARLALSLGVSGAGLALAAVIAGIGFRAIAIVSAIVSAVSAILVVGLIVLTAPFVDLGVALSIPDGDWVLMVGGAVLVFSAIGLAWAMSSGDLARYQARGTSGSAALLWTALGATVPAFALIAWGAVLAASNPVLAEGLQQNPLDLIGRLLPLWYPAPLIAAVALSLICAAVLALYSGGFALLAVGMRAPRWAGVLVVVVLAGALTSALVLLVPDTTALLRDVLTTAAVPIAAWAGIFGAETMIRSRRVHSPSLLRRGGVYPAVRWTNLVMLVVIVGAAWGFTTATTAGLTWQGYLFGPLGVAVDSSLASADLGVIGALVLGLLTPLVAGIPALRRLQTAEREASERDALANGDAAAPVAGAAPFAAGTSA